MRSRDFFEQVRDAVRDIEKISRQLEAMESREGVRTQRYGPRVSGGTPDPMAMVDARLDREKLLRARMESDYELLDRAHALIYGADSHGGIAALLGTDTADTMYWRYCAGETWPKVAKAVCYSQAWCYKAAATAHDMVDSLGFHGVLMGEGIAES